VRDFARQRRDQAACVEFALWVAQGPKFWGFGLSSNPEKSRKCAGVREMFGDPPRPLQALPPRMPLEFALRPRIRIAEGFAPPRRSRWRVPKLVLPIAAYWLTAAGITYELIHWHDSPTAPTAEPALAAPAVEPTARAWWEAPVVPEPAARPVQAPATPPPAPSPPLTPDPEEPAPVVAEAEPSAPELGAPAPAFSAPAETSRSHRRHAQIEPETSPRAARELTPLSALSEAYVVGSTGALVRAEDIAPLTPDSAPEPAPAPSSRTAALAPDVPDSGGLPSCEAAAAAAKQDIDFAHRDTTPDLSRDAIAQVLDNGVWIARCDIPMSTAIDLCVAIQNGKVIGVSVSSRPASAAINRCVKRRAMGLHFPYSSRVDVAKTHF
jgi:hypothetical protein